MSEEKNKEEVEGFIAWHPERGVYDMEILRSAELAMERLCVGEGYYEDDDFCPGPICPDEAKEDGWRIRPCKIVFTDEEVK